MIDTRYLRGSDGTGSAVLAHVSVNRLAGATTLKVDNVDNWSPFFIATSGKLNPAGYIIESTKKEFRGHLQGVDIIIDGFEPGFTDEGNTTDQVVILKQTTGWANRAQDALEELQGVVQTDLPQQFSESSADFVVSGGIWSLISGRNATMTALVAYIKGYRNTITAVATRTFTASKDTYVDVLRNTTTGAFSLVYTEVTNGAASPALAANSLRLAKIVTNASTITSVFQEGTFDSLNNLIRPLAVGTKYTDANGWTVYEGGTYREYERDITISTGAIVAQGIASTSNFAPPVSITSLVGCTVLTSLRATGFDANRFSYTLQQRSLPTNLFVEVFNAWTGGALSLAGTFSVRIRKQSS